MQENRLHVQLKNYFAGETGQQEVWIDGYFIDVVQDGLLIEVQTRSFSSIKQKLLTLLTDHPVLLVHPIPVVKWIIQWPSDGDTPISRRKSPRKGRIEHLFNELIRFPELVNHPNFSICLVMTLEEEYRRQDGRGSWRRKGVSIVDRNLLKVVELHMFRDTQDFLALLPANMEQPFTNRQLSRSSGLPIHLTRKMSYCLRQMGAIQVFGKQQREMLYKATLPAYNPHATSLDGENHEQ